MPDPIDTRVLDKLRTFDTPTICNVIELFDFRPRTAGYMDKRIKAAFPEMPPMVGFAATITCRTTIQPRGGDAYAAVPDQIARFEELPGPPVVVFQDLDTPPDAATFGELMCTAYKTFGAAGLITNGPGRDLDQVRAIDFPIFTDGAVCSHGYITLLDIHVPVHVGGLAVYPGDLLHGDVNGVTNIPSEIASEVAEVGDEFVAAEAIVLDALHDPHTSLAKLREANTAKAAKIAELSRRVTAKR
jgi:4-hydroxy-4-methyl-2-oxoglutarate aldolase